MTLPLSNDLKESIVGGKKAELLQGTLDLLILKTLLIEPMHGWRISKRILQMSGGLLEVNQGSLYPALYRLRDRGLIQSQWVVSGNDRRIKVYEITKDGRTALQKEQEGFRLFVGAVEQILTAT